MNEGLAQVHRELGEIVLSLSRRLGGTADAELARGILAQAQEFNFRLGVVGRLLFRERSIDLEEKARRIKEAGARVERALEDLKEWTAFENACADLMALVDDTIALARSATDPRPNP